VPDLIIKNSANANPFSLMSQYAYANVDSNGTVSLVYTFENFNTRCALHFAKFPYDKQTCNISISSWSLSANMLNMTANDSSMLDLYMESPDWELQDLTVTSSTSSDLFASALSAYTPSGSVDFQLHIKRRPLYFMITNVFPCLVLNLLTMIAFALPSSSQFGLCITIFLTFSVTSVRVTADTPVQSVYITAISLYFILSELITLVVFLWFVSENLMRSNFYIPRPVLLLAKSLRMLKRPKWLLLGKKVDADKEKKDDKGKKDENEKKDDSGESGTDKKEVRKNVLFDLEKFSAIFDIFSSFIGQR
jgi:hypothetical protein